MRRVQLWGLLSLAAVGCGVEPNEAAEVSAAPATARAQQELTSVDALLVPAPRQQTGTYDDFGKTLTAGQAFSKVLFAGLNPFDPSHYQRLGLISVNAFSIAEGKFVFDNAVVGDDLGFQRVFGFRDGLSIILPELLVAILQLNGRFTTNLRITLQKDVTLGSKTVRKGEVLDTGLDVEAGALLPIGLRADLNITCAICHVTLDENGQRLNGIPNGDLNAAALVALTPNTAAAVGRLSINVTDPAINTGLGKQIISSTGAVVRLPDPVGLERVADDVVLEVPPGHFESSIDRISNTTQIPHVFTWGQRVFGFDGAFQTGPFAGLSASSSAVHSSEVNIIANAFDSTRLDIDSQVYEGILLQNSAEAGLRLPATPVRPSEFLRSKVPNPYDGELEKQVIAPGSGPYPFLLPTLATFNGLLWSPNSGELLTIGSGKFMQADNAMAQYQHSLVPPANKTARNQAALASGAVRRGGQVFLNAGCASCHPAPFFTDNVVHRNAVLQMNPARAESRIASDGLLSPPRLYAFDESVPIRAGAREVRVPTAGITDDTRRLPFGTRDRGYKTLSLRALFLTAPYFHDGGAGVAEGALAYGANGTFTVADPTGLGIPGTLKAFRKLDAAGSLRAVLDSGLRARVVAANRAEPGLLRQNLDGTGHNFYVDASTGFSAAQQADLVEFLLSLDDNPGAF